MGRDIGLEAEAHATSTHRNLRQLFHKTERAIADNAFQQAAAHLGELIDAARGHFRTTEEIAFHAGMTEETAGWPMHNALLDRARILQARCQNDQKGTCISMIRNELVVLLSDMVEYDIRFANEVEIARTCTNEQEA
ncbi:hypothetical protein BEN30_12115 [Magnetovibrio blakemorei]|uniref:Hemerythrin-like domain-containing protein n=2 Tax=Magnetovibrio blakemorei TaxID=28181 RepID=A0A1E5Q6Q6_9PROT|nr:hypothetical protein BEN30_12115 [Magnetovibrio blakemorei]